MRNKARGRAFQKAEASKMSKRIEVLLWSVALPGLGQLLNRQYLKGVLFLGLEFLVNLQSNFNTVILLSFKGQIDQAISQTDYQWLMFYPCLYLFSLWDAYKDADGGGSPYAFLPFVISAFLTTVGLIYSSNVILFGSLWGPVWLPILFCIIGFSLGLLLKGVLS
ncbi:hypothetical protein MO973_13275 [Paenibacillus sp. TRM 82003]|nr:hypothetical protein [Paenibacillus sp. TRM 82003]